MAKKGRKSGAPSSTPQTPAREASNASPQGQETLESSAPPPPPKLSIWGLVRNANVQKALQLVVLGALFSPVSQMNLTPVYGSVGASLFHRYGLTATVLAAFALKGYLPKWTRRAIPAFCFWIPTLQFVLFKTSGSLGPIAGPVLTEALTYYILLLISVYVALESLDELQLSRMYNSSLADSAPAMGLFVVFTIVQRGAKGWIPTWAGSKLLNSRIGMQFVIATLYALVLPRSIIWPSVPSVAFTMLANPHAPLVRTTEVLNGTLALYDYTLLDRRESLTGYISVLEDHKKQFRVMRCDHSLLGGEWRIPAPIGVDQKVAEPIYGIFAMLEAVRLVEPSTPDKGKRALNIGLGIGTAPSALMAHGINVRIFEIDPAVHEFAMKYFALSPNHTAYIGDARQAVIEANATDSNSYDYIIHDVFTGGAEPAELFTIEFLSGLHSLLKDNGVIAINYAGDLSMPASSIIYRTITSIFPSCRVFREDEAPSSLGTNKPDFTNMVFFCKKTVAPIKFRKPLEADYLGSGARKDFLYPRHEIQAEHFEQDGDVLTSTNTRDIAKWQGQSALGHWTIMRRVLPDVIWENW